MHATVAERPWLKNYPPVVHHDIDLSQVTTLADMIRQSIARYGGREAFESFGKSITFTELGRAADAFAADLQARGFVKGDRIALMMPNILAYPVALCGVLLGGYTVVNVNPLYTPRELIHQLNDSGARAIVVIENFAHVVEEALPSLKLDAVYLATPGDMIGRCRSGRTTWPFSSTRAAPPASPRARRCSTATSSPTSCNARPGWTGPSTARAIRLISGM